MTHTERHSPSFGALLHTLRCRQRLTQQQLAQALGVHRSTIIRVGDYLGEARTVTKNDRT